MKIFVLLLTSLLFTACLRDGTDTGNPGFNNTGGKDEQGSTPLGELFTTTCSQIKVCHESINTNSCFDAILEQENIDTEIGLKEDDFFNLKEVFKAVADKVIEPDTEAIDICKQDIKELSCDLPQLQDAYIEEHENPYKGVAEMLPETCEMIFQ